VRVSHAFFLFFSLPGISPGAVVSVFFAVQLLNFFLLNEIHVKACSRKKNVPSYNITAPATVYSLALSFVLTIIVHRHYEY